VTSCRQAGIESHSGAWGNILMEPLWGENFKIIFCLKWCILVYFIFLNDGRPPKHRGVRGNLPPLLSSLSMGLQTSTDLTRERMFQQDGDPAHTSKSTITGWMQIRDTTFHRRTGRLIYRISFRLRTFGVYGKSCLCRP